MKTRFLSSLAMLPLLLVLYYGGYPLMIACFLVGFFGVREFYKGFETLDIHANHWVALIAIVSLYAIHLLQSFDAFKQTDWMMFWFFGVILLSLLTLFQIEKRKLEDALVTITGIFYVIYFSFHVQLIASIQLKFIWLVFLTAFGTDIMAYFSGYLFGKHKLCPKISPKKTIEGAIGGTLGSIILCGLFGYFILPQFMVHCMVIGALGGVVSQFGDLTASIFKRKMGIKDYGNLIPGHGGIMDRFDSVLFTAPMVYYYIILVLK
ncbi:phosphatidate cytidylyltransferase [Anaerovorax sp. IOR16]|uniref:phosphatidate cytidylyltransferase n=1 Tax=Anaerovorax sp. IOR16 TaxID=2773458 RepID=UPI0019CFF0CB|nr:phosphatidate cytidylyltransferase [Anaerovorax sp. IOR16]